ncbi:MAG TPA: TetR family transcriptional regulator [Candidatus Polarisedimenticolaceae bacterium]|nr:TetR family transcriptional regulator [Candidatus Polarisedimenticolaceae bacterium]
MSDRAGPIRIVPRRESGGAPERLLEAAERLFAERGFDGASVRDLTAEAGVNIAAVNYHFGGKENLYRQMMLRRAQELSDRRLAAVRAIAARPRSQVVLEDLLRAFALAFLEPLAEPTRGSRFFRLLIREVGAPRLGRDVWDVLSSAVEQEFIAELRRFEPGVSETDARFSLHALRGHLGHVVQVAELTGSLQSGKPLGFTLPKLVERLVDYTAAGIRAQAQ